MRHVGLALTGLLLLGGAGSATAGARQNEQGVALLADAAQRVDIRHEGSPPFTLKARVRVWNEIKGTTDGTLTFTWLGPSENRKELVLPAWRETRLVQGGKLHVAREPDCDPPRAAWPLTLFGWALDPAVLAGERAAKVQARGKSLACVRVVKPNLDFDTRCVDGSTGTVVRIEDRTHVIEYADFAPWGDHVFPRTLRWSEGRSVAVEITVDGIAPASADGFDATPPKGATEWVHAADWTEPVLAASPLEYPREAVRDQLTGEIHLAGTIGADGRSRDVTIACPSHFTDLDKITLAAVRRWRWIPATSGGQPVASELRVSIDYQLLPVLPGD